MDSLVLSRRDFWIVWRYHGIWQVHFYFLFRTDDKKRHLDEHDFRHCCFFFFSKVPFFKLLDHSYVQSSFSVITRHVHNSVLKGSLQLNILRTWINICEFFHQDLGKDHETKVNEGNRQIISCTKIRACTSKNIAPK